MTLKTKRKTIDFTKSRIGFGRCVVAAELLTNGFCFGVGKYGRRIASRSCGVRSFPEVSKSCRYRSVWRDSGMTRLSIKGFGEVKLRARRLNYNKDVVITIIERN